MSLETNRCTGNTTLRVLHIGKYFPPFRGGMETYLRDLMLSTTALGVRSTALVHNHVRCFRASTSQLESQEGQLTVMRAARWMNLSFAPVSPGFPFALRQMIKLEKPDVLHFHLPNASAFWALILPRARRLPWVIHWHSDVPDTMLASNPWLKPLASLYRALEEAMLRSATRIIATSPPYFRTSRFLSMFTKKCVVIPLGIPLYDDGRMMSSSDTPDSDLNSQLKVLAVGRLSYYKGFDVLLDAISRTPNVQLQLVGDGNFEDELKRHAVALSISSRVSFRGSLSDEDLEAAWAWSDCFCLPSVERTEAFGIVLLEAMARGKACIVSDVPGSGMGWLVEEGVTGLKVEPANAQAMSDSLHAAQNDREALERMGLAGQAKFRNQLDIGISAPRVRRVYEEVINHD